MVHKKKVILLAGPTASGKSKLAIKIAQHFKGEIINADSMQVYREILILNSRPSIIDTKIIKHHLYGFHSVKNFFSTGLWIRLVKKKIKEQWKAGKIPVVVGGTGLYFKALTDGLVKIPEVPKKVRKEIRMLHQKIGQKAFYNKLIKLDPLAKKFISENDKHRTMRAFEVKKFTNKSLFSFIKKTKPYFKNEVFVKLFIDTPKDILHKKIKIRVDKMFNDGAIKEVKKFGKIKIDTNLSSNKIIGIKEISDYLHGKTSLIKTKELVAQKTRQYAKRQFTWFRGHMKSWETVYLTNINDLYKKIANKIL